MNNLTSKYLFDLMQRYRTEMRNAVGAKSLKINAMHIQCLRHIAETTNCTANCIVQGLLRDKSQISLVLKDMVDKGWVQTLPNPDDKRSKLLVLTESGQELLNKIRQEESVIGTRMQQGLSDEEVETFHRLIQIMLKNLH